MPTVAQSATPADLIQKGQAYYNQGQFKQAIAFWRQAEQAYNQDQVGVAGSRINQAQALMAMGQQRQACKLLVATIYQNLAADRLCEPISTEEPILQPKPLPASLTGMGLQKLGEALRFMGNLETAEWILRQQWSQTSNTSRSELLLSLGNVFRDLGNRDRDRTEQLNLPSIKVDSCLSQTTANTKAVTYYNQAIACYQEATQGESTDWIRVQANLNYLSLLLDIRQWLQQNSPESQSDWLAVELLKVDSLIQQVRSQIELLPDTIERFYTELNFAHSLTLATTYQLIQQNEAEQLFIHTIEKARQWQDPKLQAMAVGKLGWFYEQTNRLTNAIKQTEFALSLARSLEINRIQSQDLTYQWEWQRGRILRRLGQNQAAIVAYENAINALETVREQVIAVNPDAQFALRDNIEPVYRELIDLLLPVDQSVSQETLKSVLGYLDALQLAQLENFLRCRVEVTKKNQINPVRDRTTAFVYSIVLPDRLEVIVQIAQQPLQRRTEPIEQTQLNQVLQQIIQDMKRDKNSDEPNPILVQQKSSERLYSWLIRDFKPVLEQNSIKTLVFISDGLLRNIPMAALYDAQTSEYLIDQYAIAVTPGSPVLGAKENKHQQKRALIAGLTTSPPASLPIRNMPFSFGSLENVAAEVKEIQALLPQSDVLIGKDFTPTNFRTKFNSSYYPIVHLATHGYFSSDPRQTFILTDAGQYILVDELQRLVRNRQDMRPEPIELMVLSACQTATGDRRSTLGMAGAAIRAGANSTLASLWSVDDASTAEMMQAFYQVLTQSQPPVSKAEALRQAQLKIRANYKFTYNWASFVLVGNWL